MRRLADEARIRAFMRAVGSEAAQAARIYFAGGATAVLLGWRPSTIDVDVRMVPEEDRLLRAMARLKDELEINVELACPADFLPELPGWEERSLHVDRHGKAEFFHYDPYAQTLAKIERGHALDRADATEFVRRGLVQPPELLRLFERIQDQLYRFPAVDPVSLRRCVERFVQGFKD